MRRPSILFALAAVAVGVAAVALPPAAARAQTPAPPQRPNVLWAEAAESPAAQPPAGQPAATTQPAASQPAARPGPLPGIALDKHRRRVLVNCTSLYPKDMLLELLACAPQWKEHESVLRVNARPQNVHLALLLCGFEPGHPFGYNEVEDKPILPAGDRVDIQIQWVDPKTGQTRTAPIEDWMTPVDPAKPMPHLKWLFAGSRTFEDGKYWADQEGSIVSISNFPDAVIDLAGRHTDVNEQLEFKINEKTIPPAGTKCTMILLPPADLPIELDRFGKLTVEGHAVPANRLAEALARHKAARDDARVELIVSPDAIKADVDKLVEQCKAAGFAADRITRRAATTQPAGAFVFPANDPRAAIDLLTGQWREHRQTVESNIQAQRQWLEQIDGRRQVLARQYRELTDYIDRARQQYRQALAELRTGD